MREEFKRYWLQPGILMVLIIAVDQFTKAWILDLLGPVEGASVPLIAGQLSLTMVHNTGVAFGLFRGFPHFFTLTSILISLGAIYFYRFHLPGQSRWVQVSVGLIIGGAIGNIIDRLRFGYVVDFVHIHWFPGIFNIADSAITIGVIMLAGYLLFAADPPERTRANDDVLLNDLLSQSPASKPSQES